MVETTVETKRCTGPCGLEKPLSEFHKHSSAKMEYALYAKPVTNRRIDTQVEQRRVNGGNEKTHSCKTVQWTLPTR